jgi:hypothetical protein
MSLEDINTETGPPGWGLEARLTTLFCVNVTVLQNPKNRKPHDEEDKE